ASANASGAVVKITRIWMFIIAFILYSTALVKPFLARSRPMSPRDWRDNERNPKSVQAFFLFIAQIGETRIWSEFGRPVTVPQWRRFDNALRHLRRCLLPQRNRIVLHR